jgi:LPS-assembly protein
MRKLMRPISYGIGHAVKHKASAFRPAILRSLGRGSCVICLLLLFCGMVWGQNLDSLLGDAQFPWHITADELSFDDAQQIYIATGNVLISKMDKQIRADTVHFNHKNMQAQATGHVTMTVGQDLITADSLQIDLTTEQGTLQGGSFFLYQENFHIKGDEIVKTGKDSYHADKASLTTCDGEKPAWKITGRNLNVTIEGYGYAHHAVFWVKDIPVFYTPFISFPVKTKRQTGLLPPQIGSSSRKGFEYHQPFFWAINESMDATFYDHFMDLRGNKLGAEVRYVMSPLTKGTLMIDYLDDDKVDDNVDGSHDWGYDDALDDTNQRDEDVLRPNNDRYWFRMKHDQTLPWRFSTNLDLDIVSDQDYLKEFKGGYTGYEFTDDYFNDEFNRNIDDYNDPIRLNRLNINRSWSVFNLNAEFRWYDNIINRQLEDRDTTVQRLPFIRLTAHKQQLGSTPFYGTMENEYTYFYRENTDTQNRVTKDHRLDIYPRVYLPLSWKYYFTIEPSMGLRETYWQAADYEDPLDDMEDKETFHRELPDYRIALATEIYNILQTGGDRIDRFKHSVRPGIVYTYIPEEDQLEYPDFDARDRIEKENKLTYFLTNLFTSRSRLEKKKSTAEETADPEFHYQQFLRLYLEQSYDFNEAGEDDPLEWGNGESREPFSPAYGLVEITPEKYIRLKADAEWSTYENELMSRNVSTTLWDRRGDHLSIENRWKQDIPNIGQEGLESIYAKLQITMTEALSATAEYEEDLYEGKELLASIGALYKAQCWSFQLTFTREEEEERYDFMIGLNGLGEIESEF